MLEEARPPAFARRSFFEASIVARRRSRKSWTGTPLRAVFAFAGPDVVGIGVEVVGLNEFFCYVVL